MDKEGLLQKTNSNGVALVFEVEVHAFIRY